MLALVLGEESLGAGASEKALMLAGFIYSRRDDRGDFSRLRVSVGGTFQCSEVRLSVVEDKLFTNELTVFKVPPVGVWLSFFVLRCCDV